MQSEVESALGDLHLPDIVGRYYARPTVAAPIQVIPHLLHRTLRELVE
jgi:hypothetical protein